MHIIQHGSRRKQYLQPLYAFSWLSVYPKCIYGQGYIPNHDGKAYSTPTVHTK